jgi:hypothetical protein
MWALAMAATRHERPVAVAVGQLPGDRGHDHRRRGPGQQAQPGLERCQALRRLEELRHQEEGPEEAGVEEEADTVGGGESPLAEHGQRQHGLGCPLFPSDEQPDHQRPGHQRAQHLAVGPAQGVGSHQPPGDPEEAGAGQDQPDHIQPGPRPEALTQA